MKKLKIIDDKFYLYPVKKSENIDEFSFVSKMDDEKKDYIFEYKQNDNLLSVAIEEYKKQKLNYKLPIMLGLNYDNEYQFADLADLKHLILAGQTCSGKSVFENAIIYTFLSLIPNNIKFLFSDVKRVELTPYTGIPQLISKVIVEQKDFFIELEKLVEEKDRRLDSNEKYPYIIAVFDTISDLVLYDRQQFDSLMEELLINAHKAKIHVIVSDSRPSSSVFTPTIMSLIPTKMCFATASIDDSQYIIHSDLAHYLYGKGDVLLLKQKTAQPVRLQTPWISDEEIEKLIHKV